MRFDEVKMRVMRGEMPQEVLKWKVKRNGYFDEDWIRMRKEMGLPLEWSPSD